MAFRTLTSVPKYCIVTLVMNMKLKEYRIQLGITIKEASFACNVPLRTYIRYENDEAYGNDLKRKHILLLLKEKYQITEEKGLLTIDKIKTITHFVFSKYENEVQFCYLFGSYAKGYANENSDVDLCVSTSLSGLSFVGLIEELRIALNKKVDLIRINDLGDNISLINEIMKDGMKIYG